MSLGQLVGPLVAGALGDYGSTVTLKKATKTFDPATQQASVAAASYTVKGAVTAYRTREIDGTTIQAGDVRVVIAADALAAKGAPAPEIGDRIAWVSGEGEVKNADQVIVTDKIVSYTLQVRQ